MTSAGVLGLTRAPEQQRSEHLRHDDSQSPLAPHIGLYEAVAVGPADDTVRTPEPHRCSVVFRIKVGLLCIVLTCKA